MILSSFFQAFAFLAMTFAGPTIPVPGDDGTTINVPYDTFVPTVYDNPNEYVPGDVFEVREDGTAWFLGNNADPDMPVDGARDWGMGETYLTRGFYFIDDSGVLFNADDPTYPVG